MGMIDRNHSEHRLFRTAIILIQSTEPILNYDANIIHFKLEKGHYTH